MKPKIYFDNDIISRLLGIKNPEYVHNIIKLKLIEKNAINKLWNLHKQGKVVIVTSAETRRELERHPEQYKDQEIKRLEYYKEIEKIPVTSGIKYGQYKYGEGKYGVSPIKEKVASIIPEHNGKEMDVKHIVNFIDCRTCQFFVTLDGRILHVKDVLLKKFHVRIEKPSIVLQKISTCLNICRE